MDKTNEVDLLERLYITGKISLFVDNLLEFDKICLVVDKYLQALVELGFYKVEESLS
jgi:hypothetical protein